MKGSPIFSRRNLTDTELSTASSNQAPQRTNTGAFEAFPVFRRSKNNRNSSPSKISTNSSSKYSQRHSFTTSEVSSSRRSEGSKVCLLERFGGDTTLEGVVEAFYKRLVEDPVLGIFFIGVSMSKVKRHQRAFLKLVFSKVPESADVPLYILQKHERLFQHHGLNELHFDMFLAHLVETLQATGAVKSDIDEAKSIMLSFRPIFQHEAEVVNAKDVLQLMSKTDFPLPSTEEGVVESLMHLLQASEITLVRVVSIGVGGSNIKSIPVEGIRANTLVRFQNNLVVKPDFASLRVLPHSKMAMVFGYSVSEAALQQLTLRSECPRGLLARVVTTALAKHGLDFRIGGSLKFRLLGNEFDIQDQESLLATVLMRLKEFNVPISHAECGEPDIDIVFGDQRNPVKFVDMLTLAQDIVLGAAKEAGQIVSFERFLGNHGLALQISCRKKVKENELDDKQLKNDNYVTLEDQSFVEGVLERLPALMAVTSGTFCENSKLGWDFDDKDSPIKVGRRNENPFYMVYRLADATVNLYLSVALILACGVVGTLENKTLRPPLNNTEKNSELPASLEEALDLFETDDLLQHVMGPDLTLGFLVARRDEPSPPVSMSHSFVYSS